MQSSMDAFVSSKKRPADKPTDESDASDKKKKRQAKGFLEALLTEESWAQELESEFSQPYFSQLSSTVEKAFAAGPVYPPTNDIFSAFSLTPLNDVRVVIIGQDPYHGAGQAHGLCFSVRKGIAIPPSLHRIYKELVQDTDVKNFNAAPIHGFLNGWAEQGVFMLNATLTVEQGKPNSHEKIGWQKFTDAVIRALAKRRSGIVYMLWGKFAQKKAAAVDRKKNLVLESVHPSPLAGNEWFGNKHFSKANTYLAEQGKKPIDWASLP